jgi:hypothetical protein
MMTQPRGWPIGGQSPSFADLNIFWPAQLPLAQSYSTLRADGLNDGLAQVFPMPKTGTLTEFQYSIGSIVATGDVTGSIELVNTTTGLVDGTLAAAGASGVVTCTLGAATQWYTFTLSTPLYVNRGQQYAAVLRIGTPGDVRIYYTTITENPNAYPCALTNTAGTWTKVGGTAITGRFKIDGEWVRQEWAWPYEATAAARNVSVSTTPDEVGNLLTMPATVRSSGAWVYLNGVGTNRDWTLKLYDANNDVLASSSIDCDTVSFSVAQPYHSIWSEDVVLEKDKTYRLTYAATGSSNTSFYTVSVNTTEFSHLLPGDGNCIYTQRTDGGAWAETATKHGVIGLILNGVSL